MCRPRGADAAGRSHRVRVERGWRNTRVLRSRMHHPHQCRQQTGLHIHHSQPEVLRLPSTSSASAQRGRCSSSQLQQPRPHQARRPVRLGRRALPHPQGGPGRRHRRRPVRRRGVRTASPQRRSVRAAIPSSVRGPTRQYLVDAETGADKFNTLTLERGRPELMGYGTSVTPRSGVVLAHHARPLHR